MLVVIYIFNNISFSAYLYYLILVTVRYSNLIIFSSFYPLPFAGDGGSLLVLNATILKFLVSIEIELILDFVVCNLVVHTIWKRC